MKRLLGLAGNAASSLAESAASSLAGGSAESSNSRSSNSRSSSGSRGSPRDNHSETGSWPDPDASSSSGSAPKSRSSERSQRSATRAHQPSSAEAEILALLQVGTQVEVLYAMFPPPLVDRVVQQQQQQPTESSPKERRGSGVSHFSGLERPSVDSVGSGGSRYSGYTPPSSQNSRRRRREDGAYSSGSSRQSYDDSQRHSSSSRGDDSNSYPSSHSGSRYSRHSRDSRYSGDSRSRYSGDSRSYISGSSDSWSGSGSRNRGSPVNDRPAEVTGWPVSPETSNHSSEHSDHQQPQELPQQLSSPEQEEGSEDSISLSEIMSHRSNSQSSGESGSRSSGSDYSRSQGSRSYYSDDSRSQYSGSRSYYSGSSRSRSEDSEAFEQDKQDILRLVQLGTDVAVIEDMFSPEIVRRVLDPSERYDEEGSDSRSQYTGDSRSGSGSHYSDESEQDTRDTKSRSGEGGGDHQSIAESHTTSLDDVSDTGVNVQKRHDEEDNASREKQAAIPTEDEKSVTKEAVSGNDNVSLTDKVPIEKDDAVSIASQSKHSSRSQEGASFPFDSDNDGQDALTTQEDEPQTQKPGDTDNVSRGSHSSRSLPTDSDSDFSAERAEANNETQVESDAISHDGDISERSSRGEESLASSADSVSRHSPLDDNGADIDMKADDSSYSHSDDSSRASEGSGFPDGIQDTSGNDEASVFDSDVDVDSRASGDSDRSSSSVETEHVEAQELLEQNDASGSNRDGMVDDKEERVVTDMVGINNPSPEPPRLHDQAGEDNSVSCDSNKDSSVDKTKPRDDAETATPVKSVAHKKKSFLDSSESDSESYEDDDEISVASGTDKKTKGVEAKKKSFLDSSDSESSSSNENLSVDNDVVLDPTPSESAPIEEGDSGGSYGGEKSSEQKSDELADKSATGPLPDTSADAGSSSSNEGSYVDEDTESRDGSSYDSRSDGSSNFDNESGEGSRIIKQADSTNVNSEARNTGTVIGENHDVSDGGSSYGSRESFDDAVSLATPESARDSYNSESEGESDEGSRHDSVPGESGHSSQSQSYGESDSESAGYSNVDSFAVESGHPFFTGTSTNVSTSNAHDGGHTSPSHRSNSVSSDGFSSSQMSSHMDSFALPSDHNLSSQHTAPNQTDEAESDNDNDDVISSSSNSQNGDNDRGEEQDNDSESYSSEGSRSYNEGSASFESSSEDLNVHSFAVESEHPISLNQSGSTQEQSSTSGPQQERIVHSSASQPSDALSSDDDSHHHSFAIESEHAPSASQGTASGGKQQSLQESISESQSGSRASSRGSGSRSSSQSKSDEEFLFDLETQIVELESEVNKIEAEIENLLKTGTKVDVLYTMYSQDEVDRVLKRGTGAVLVAKAAGYVGKTTEASNENSLSSQVEKGDEGSYSSVSPSDSSSATSDGKRDVEARPVDETEKLPVSQHSSGIMGRFFGTKVKKDIIEPTSVIESRVENDDESEDENVSSTEDSNVGKASNTKLPAEQDDLASSTHSSIMGRFFGMKPKNDATDNQTSRSVLDDVVVGDDSDDSGHSSSASDDESSMTKEKESETDVVYDDSSPRIQDEKEEDKTSSEQETLPKSASSTGGGLLGLGRLFGMKSKKEDDDIEPSEATKTDTAVGTERGEKREESSQDEDIGAIYDLLDAGTDRVVLEAMFSPEAIARAIGKGESGVGKGSVLPELIKNGAQNDPDNEASAENKSNASSLHSSGSMISGEGGAQEDSSPSAHDASPDRDSSSGGSKGDGWPVSPASSSRSRNRSYSSKGGGSEGNGSFQSQSNGSNGSYGSADDSYNSGDAENREGGGSLHSQSDGSYGSSDNGSYRSQDDRSYHSGSGNDRSYYSDEASRSSYDSEVEEVRDDIERLLKLGTDRTVLEEMYSADVVTRVLELQNKENDGHDASDGSYDAKNDEQSKDDFVSPPYKGASEQEVRSSGDTARDKDDEALHGSDNASQSDRQKEVDSVGSEESSNNDHEQPPEVGPIDNSGDQDVEEVSGSSAAAFPSQEEEGSYASSDFSTSPSEALNEKSVLRLTLEGVDMANVEGFFGCSDPFFQIDASMKGFEGITLWQSIHRSEYIERNLNPKWSPVEVSIDLLCQLDLDRPIRISVYDWEKSGKHQPMGHFETTVGDVLQAKASKRKGQWDLSKAFPSLSDKGEVMGMIVVADAYAETPPIIKSKRKSRHSVVPDMVDQDSTLCLTLEGVDMKNVERWIGCSDPFFQVETPMKGPGGSIMWQHIHQSEHIDNNLNPRWKPAEINLDLLCQLDLDKPIRFSLFDWEASGRHNPMGHFVTSVNRLLRSKAVKQDDNWELARAFTTKGDDGQEFGKIVVVDVTLESADDSKGGNENKRKSSTIAPTIPVIKMDKKSALVLTLEAVKFSNVAGWGSTSNPFFEVLIPVQDFDDATVWKTLFSSEHKKGNLNPRWDPAILALEKLCQLDLDKPIRIVVQDWVENGKHIEMGHFETSMNRLLRSKARREGDNWDLANSFIATSMEGQEFGRVVVVDVSIDPDGAKNVKAEARSKETSSNASGSVSAESSFDGSLSDEDGHNNDSEPTDEVLATIRNLLEAGTDREVLVGMFDSRHVAQALAGENQPKSDSQRGGEFEEASSSDGASSGYGSDSYSGHEALTQTQNDSDESGRNSQSFDDNSVYGSDGFSSRSSVEHSGSPESPPGSSSEKSLVEREDKTDPDSVAIAIQNLYDAGTDPSVLKTMFSPADVLRVIGGEETSQHIDDKSDFSGGLSAESDNQSFSAGSEASKASAYNEFTATKEDEDHSYSSEASSEESQLMSLWGNESKVGETDAVDNSGAAVNAMDQDPFGAAWPMEDHPLNEDDILAIQNMYDAGTDRDVLVNMFNQDQVTQVLGPESLEGSASFSAGSSEFSDENSEASSSLASSREGRRTQALRGESPADASKEDRSERADRGNSTQTTQWQDDRNSIESVESEDSTDSEKLDFPTSPDNPFDDKRVFSQDAVIPAANQDSEDNASSSQKDEVSEGSHSSASYFSPSPSSFNSFNDTKGAKKVKGKVFPVEESSKSKVKANADDKKREVRPKSESLPIDQKRTGSDKSVSSFGSNIVDDPSDSSEASSEESRSKNLWGGNEQDQKDVTEDVVPADNFADDMDWPDTEEIPAPSASSKLDEDIMYWLDSGTPLDIVETMYSPDDVARVLRSRENRKSGKDDVTAEEPPPNQPGTQHRAVAQEKIKAKEAKKKGKKKINKSVESTSKSDNHLPTEAENRGKGSKQRSSWSSAEEEPKLVVSDDKYGTHSQTEKTQIKPTLPRSSGSSSSKSKNSHNSDAEFEAATSHEVSLGNSHEVSLGNKSSVESSWSSSSKSKLSIASGPQRDLSRESEPQELLEETAPEASSSLHSSWSSLGKSKASIKSGTKTDSGSFKQSSEKARTSEKKQRSLHSSWSSSSKTPGMADKSDANTNAAKSRQPFVKASTAAKKQRSSSRSSWSSSSKTSGRVEKNMLRGSSVSSASFHPEQALERRWEPSSKQQSNLGDKSHTFPSQEEPKKTIVAVQSTVLSLETLQAENEKLKRENKKLEKAMAARLMDADEISSNATSKSDTVTTEARGGSRTLAKENRSLLKRVSKLEQKTIRQGKQLQKVVEELRVSSSEKLELQNQIVTLLDTPKGARALAYKRSTDAKVSVYQDRILDSKQKIRMLEEKNRSYAESLSVTAEKGAAFRKQLIKANKKIDIITAENQALAGSLDSSLQQQESLHLSLLSATQEWKDRECILEDEIEQEMERKLKDKFSEYDESLREAAHEIEVLSEERDGLTAEVSRLQDVATDRKHLLVDINDKLRYTSVENLEAIARYERSQKKCHLLSSAVEVLQQNLKDKDNEMLLLHEATRALKEDLTRAYEEVWVAEQDKNEIAERARDLDISLGRYKMTLTETYKQLDTATDENGELERSLLQSISECRALREANDLAETSLKTTEANIQSYHDILNEAKEEMDYISAENKALVEQELYRHPSQKPAYSFPRQGYYGSR